MAIADNFDHKPDAGFVRSYDARAARRQFQVSVALVVVLGIATLALGLLVHASKPQGVPEWSVIKSSASPLAETLLDNHD